MASSYLRGRPARAIALRIAALELDQKIGESPIPRARIAVPAVHGVVARNVPQIHQAPLGVPIQGPEHV